MKLIGIAKDITNKVVNYFKGDYDKSTIEIYGIGSDEKTEIKVEEEGENNEQH